MIRALAVALLLPLCGCGAIPTAISIAAGASTLLKNEFNCSLADLGSCTAPHVTVPVVVSMPSAPAPAGVAVPLAVPAPSASAPAVLTMDPVPNP